MRLIKLRKKIYVCKDIYLTHMSMYSRMVPNGHSVMTKGLRSAQQVLSSSQGVHLL